MVTVSTEEWEIVETAVNKIKAVIEGKSPEEKSIDEYNDKIHYDAENDTLFIRRIRTSAATSHQPIETVDIRIKPGVEGLKHSFIVAGLKSENPKIVALGRKHENAHLGSGANGIVVEGIEKSYSDLTDPSMRDSLGALCAIKKMRTGEDNVAIPNEIKALKQKNRSIGNFVADLHGKTRAYIVQNKIVGQDLDKIKDKHCDSYRLSMISFSASLNQTILHLQKNMKKYEKRPVFLKLYENNKVMLTFTENLNKGLSALGFSGLYPFEQLESWINESTFPMDDKTIESALKIEIIRDLKTLAESESLPKSKMFAYAVSSAQSLQQLHIEDKIIMVDFKGANIMGKQEVVDDVLLTETHIIDFGSSISIGADMINNESTGLRPLRPVDITLGEARAYDISHTMGYAPPEISSPMGQPGYNPELISKEGFIYSTKSDAYALGITIKNDFGLQDSIAAQLLTEPDPTKRISIKDATEILKLEFILSALQEKDKGADYITDVVAYAAEIAPEYKDLNIDEITTKLKKLVDTVKPVDRKTPTLLSGAKDAWMSDNTLTPPSEPDDKPAASRAPISPARSSSVPELKRSEDMPLRNITNTSSHPPRRSGK